MSIFIVVVEVVGWNVERMLLVVWEIKEVEKYKI